MFIVCFVRLSRRGVGYPPTENTSDTDEDDAEEIEEESLHWGTFGFLGGGCIVRRRGVQKRNNGREMLS